jgi:type II secretory pathway pseudopilin PulG
MRQDQRGITLIGLLCILALVGAVLYAGVRLVPLYLNYMKVARAMEQVAKDFKGDTPDQGRIRVALDRHWTIEDINQVKVTDIEVVKGDDGVSLHVAYDQSVPYIANVSLTASFDKSVKIEQ